MQPEPSPSLSEQDLTMLKRSFTMAHEARLQGKHPFAALVVAEDGTILAQALNNSLPPDGDPTCHAERIAVAMASRQADADTLKTATLYSNAEPCAMCAGATYWCGIGRVVYGLSEQNLLALTGNHPENPTLSLPCRIVFASGQRHVDVIGPCLEDQARVAHQGFWQSGAAPDESA